MKQKRRSYQNQHWYEFSERVRKRDNNKCLKCGRKPPEVTLQTHHKFYRPELEPWEYPLSDCLTLCKGCHAQQHGIIEPQNGWTLLSIDDLGGLDGICERKGCGTEIRYEHHTYHPLWGHKVVGSTCIEHLTEEDQFLSADVLKIFRNISKFIDQSTWEHGLTKKLKKYVYTVHSHHQIRIYGQENRYAFQIALKHKGERWFDFQDIIRTTNKNLNQVKELSYIVLKGLTTDDEDEKNLLRNIYVRTR